jgi:hypothetical protein
MTDPRESTQRHDADDLAADAEELPPAEGEELGSDVNELEADNPVEQDTIETLNPENPPA